MLSFRYSSPSDADTHKMPCFFTPKKNCSPLASIHTANTGKEEVAGCMTNIHLLYPSPKPSVNQQSTSLQRIQQAQSHCSPFPAIQQTLFNGNRDDLDELRQVLTELKKEEKCLQEELGYNRKTYRQLLGQLQEQNKILSQKEAYLKKDMERLLRQL